MLKTVAEEGQKLGAKCTNHFEVVDCSGRVLTALLEYLKTLLESFTPPL